MTARRVYLFPSDLVGRLQHAQVAMGAASEVGAVRILLEEALAHRESSAELQTRAENMTVAEGVASTVDMLSRHPKVTTLTRIGGGFEVVCRDGHSFRVWR